MINLRLHYKNFTSTRFQKAIDKINNMAMYNLIDTKYCQMAQRFARLDGAVAMRCLGTPGQTKVSGDHQRETNTNFFVEQSNCPSSAFFE